MNLRLIHFDKEIDDENIEYFDLGWNPDEPIVDELEPDTGDGITEPVDDDDLPPLEDLGIAPLPKPDDAEVLESDDKVPQFKSDKERFEYWQSIADKKQNKLTETEQAMNALKEKVDSFGKIAPIAEYIQKNPDLLKVINDHVSGKRVADTSKLDAPALTKPEKPVRPANYDAAEALTDPDSESFKYRSAMNDYQDNMVDYLEKADTQKQNARQQEYHKQQQQQAMNNIQSELIANYGYTKETAPQFIEKYSNPDELTLIDYIIIDRYRAKGNGSLKRKTQIIKDSSKNLSPPPPAIIGSADVPAELTEEQTFNLGLMNRKRK